MSEEKKLSLEQWTLDRRETDDYNKELFCFPRQQTNYCKCKKLRSLIIDRQNATTMSQKTKLSSVSLATKSDNRRFAKLIC